ncbi:nitric oxide reductase activation protein [Thiobacillus denitrificans ATCC] [Mycobacterium shimoidei]|uniref:Nitric oxide reductase activation protein [Thiobacillus denitrificans ATCC] n=1 Tax=Mycobacterium shimoidei TaxID=29313 RepID=A0A375YZJ4_MYCSH|nr:VWA domain-containing protein [Mycobacterium shimoidei]SRX94324.1 nitric oxide reductase activation protein [Thiobacillus denitrificans ATCC] [Mycobacterium shimoidei]
MANNISASALQRWSLLASALSGRNLQVAAAVCGEAAWTDGKTVFVDADTSARRQLEQVAVQACLLAAGSLEPAIVRRLGRRRTLASRYLAVEGHRALAASEELLPPAVWTLCDRDVAGRSDSPAATLSLLRSGAVIKEPPDSFGVIHPRKLLTASKADGPKQKTERHDPRRQRKHLTDLDDDSDDSDDVVDIFSSPVGGGGVVGRWFKKMLSSVRKLSGNGQPGADAPTHRSRSGTRGGALAVVSSATFGAEDTDADKASGIQYPEWDFHRRQYRPNWCTVQEVAPRPDDTASLPLAEGYRLRRALARLGVGLDRYHRQAQGDDVDIDAAVEARVETIAGSAPDEAVYLDSLRRRRDLSVLILLDVSGSTAEPGTVGQTVHEQQRVAAAVLTAALHDLGDRVALYAFQSQGRSAVHVLPVKRFDDHLDTLALRRLCGLKPGAFSRLGAAIRHGAAVLESRAGTPRRLLVVISDGLAYDHGYERDYGAADARRALAEARRRGTGCLCLTIGAATDVSELQRVFGSAAHATIPRVDQLHQVIGPLFRSALGSADVRRRIA